jgi:hypothetical protein
MSEQFGSSGTRAKHQHTYTALYWHFGPYGPQAVHIHDCEDGRCSHVLIGMGRDCRKGADHYSKRLTMSLPERLLENEHTNYNTGELCYCEGDS